MDSSFERHQTIINSPSLERSPCMSSSFCVAVLWLALVFWTFKDARKRIDDPIIIGVAVLDFAHPASHGHCGLRDPAAGRVSGRGPRAGTGDAGYGAGAADHAGLPFVRGADQARLCGLPQLPPASPRYLFFMREGPGAGLEACPYCGHDPRAEGWLPRRKSRCRVLGATKKPDSRRLRFG